MDERGEVFHWEGGREGWMGWSENDLVRERCETEQRLRQQTPLCYEDDC